MAYKLLVIPNDPLYKYYDKGEIKTRYWNPCNMFDEIHVVSLCDYDIDPQRIQEVFGDAKTMIHTIGKPKLYNYFSWKNKVKRIAKDVKPDVIRVHNTQIGGWLGVTVGKEMSISSMVSLHASYDEARAFYKRRKDWKNYIKQTLLGHLTETFVIKNATAIYCVYPNIFPYLNRTKRKDYSLIYNRVYAKDFPRKDNYSTNKLNILTVGRLNEHKNIDVIIKSIQNTDYTLTIIGKGEEEQKLKAIVKEKELEQQVAFIPAIRNKEMIHHYHDHDIYAMAMEAEGVSIPIIEAMASGLPIIVPEHIRNEIEAPLTYVKINPNDFRSAYKEFEDIKKRIKAGYANHKAFLEIEGNKMEEKEKELYVKIISKKIKK